MKMGMIEAIVFALFAAVILITGICIGAGVEIIVLGGLMLLAAIIFIVLEIINKKKGK